MEELKEKMKADAAAASEAGETQGHPGRLKLIGIQAYLRGKDLGDDG